ncbi:hypothetical protein [Nostoc sp.]|uniref:hypothetical protein n=1 Tax=Nostoc sp. TaxID=1180 RepID=UPI002FF612E5
MLILTVIFLSSPKSLGCISRLWGAAQQLDLSNLGLRSLFHKSRSHQGIPRNKLSNIVGWAT